MAYHYPQQAGAPPPGNPRQGLSSYESGSPPAGDYPAYPPAQPPGYGHAPPPHAAQRGFNPNGGAPDYRQWSQPAPMPPAGQEQHGYPPQQDPLQAQAEWAHPEHYGYGEPAPGEDGYQGGQPGYQHQHQQQQAGSLETSYAPDEIPDYEAEEGRRGGWAMRVGGAIIVAIGLGYGLAQGYKMMAGADPDGTTPVVLGDSNPSKTPPTDPGGKQFAHADSKVMGRLGEAGPGSGSEPSPGPGELSDSDTDASGARKVTTLVVGRDGSIAPPAAPTASEAEAAPADAVPGLTVVDGFGGRYPGVTDPSPPRHEETASAPAAEVHPVVAKPSTPAKPEVIAAVKTPEKAPPVEPVVLTTTTTPSSATPSSPAPEKSTAALAPPKETAAIPTTKPAEPAAPVESATGANGYVVVLASVPVSSQSRLSALKKFADMQEKYGTVLQNRTPDVQEANLGERGSYHRLLVGPPGSRAQASSLCSDLKSAGYKDCWVTAY